MDRSEKGVVFIGGLRQLTAVTLAGAEANANESLGKWKLRSRCGRRVSAAEWQAGQSLTTSGKARKAADSPGAWKKGRC